jgi:hypothetical protein
MIEYYRVNDRVGKFCTTDGNSRQLEYPRVILGRVTNVTEHGITVLWDGDKEASYLGKAAPLFMQEVVDSCLSILLSDCSKLSQEARYYQSMLDEKRKKLAMANKAIEELNAMLASEQKDSKPEAT